MAAGSIGKRKAERRDCRVRAQVQFPKGGAAVDCVVLNFSATGARVKLSDPVDLPQRFKLFIPSRPETKSVVLRWVRDLEFGCEFTAGLAQSEDVFFDLIDRVEALEKRILNPADGASLLLSDKGSSPSGEARLDEIDAQLATIKTKLAALAERPNDVVSVGTVADDVNADGRNDDFRTQADALSAEIAALHTKIESLENQQISLQARAANLYQQFTQTLQQTETQLRSFAAKQAEMASAITDSTDFSPIEARIAQLEEQIVAASQKYDTRSAGETPVASGGDTLRAIDDEWLQRLSNIELAVLDLRVAKPAADEAFEQRLTLLEERNNDVMSALRNVLGLLTLHENQRQAS